MKQLLTSILLTLLVSSSFAQVPSYVPTTGLMGWYPFNGNSKDESGKGNHAVNGGAVLTNDRYGWINSAYEFNSSHMVVPFSGVSPKAYTISAWFLASGTPQGGIAGLRLSPSYPTLYGIHQPSGKVVEGVQFANPTTVTTSAIVTPPPTLWTYVTLSYDTTMLRLYINGVIKDSIAVKTIAQSTDKFEMVIGMWVTGGGYNPLVKKFFTGSIDDIGIWSRALTSKEIQRLFTGTMATTGITTTSAPKSFVANPAQDKLSVNIMQTKDAGNYRLMDMNGRTVNNGNLNMGWNQIDVSALASGMYFINYGNVTERVVKQ